MNLVAKKPRSWDADSVIGRVDASVRVRVVRGMGLKHDHGPFDTRTHISSSSSFTIL